MTPSLPRLWDFALHLYAQDGMSQRCVRWQDEHQANVCVLLTLCWADHCRFVLSHRELLDVATPWAEEVVEPLRELRRKLKTKVFFDGHAQQALREEIKAIEIRSEKLLLEALEAWVLTQMEKTQSSEKQNAAAGYLAHCGVSEAEQGQLSILLNQTAATLSH